MGSVYVEELNTVVCPAERLEPALLEQWMRKYYFHCDFDIGSSGVEDYAMGELREILDIDVAEIDALVFHDSETLGGRGLRRSLADRWTGGDVDQVMATHGSSEANYLIMNALLKPGDEVVVLDPCYQQLYAIAQAIGCRLKSWAMPFRQGFSPDFDELRRLITPETKMVVVNFPHNPTGASLNPEQLQQLIKEVRRVGAYLVWDGAFTEMTFDAPPLPLPNASYERAISMGTLSKSYGLPGLRVGWCLAAPEVLEKCIHLRDYLTLHLSPLVELMAEKAVRHADRLVERRRQQAMRNRDRLGLWMEEHQEWIEWVPPAGGVSSFPRLKKVVDVEAFCHRLAQERKVLLVPGVCFGHPQHVRLGYGGSPQALEEGLQRLAAHLKKAASKTT